MPGNEERRPLLGPALETDPRRRTLTAGPGLASAIVAPGTDIVTGRPGTTR